MATTAGAIEAQMNERGKVPTHRALVAWVRSVAEHARPDTIHWCNGSQAEWDAISKALVETGTLFPLDPEKRPNSFYARPDPRDVARVESRTFMCSEAEDDAGPTNNLRPPAAMRETLSCLFNGCMSGRTMYVVPCCMVGSDKSVIGVELTDSA